MIRLTEEERLQERAEGREERNIEIAKNLLNKEMDIMFISETTGLSEEEVALLV